MIAPDTSVEWTEVGPRDGLQGLERFVPTDRKIALIEALVAAGCRSIEVTSFVHPRAIPQMRDAVELCAALPRREGVTYAAIVPNLRGLETAARAAIDRVSVLAASTDEFSQKNVNATVAEATERIRGIATEAHAAGIRVRGYVACIVECPLTGPVSPERVAKVAADLLDAGCDDVFLGETIGRGTPAAVARVLESVCGRVSADRLGVHFHDTWGQALANSLVALEHGITKLDSAVAGLGGCPNAERAAGNVASEDLLYLLQGMGIDVGADLAELARVGAAFCSAEGLRVDSKANRALVAADESPGFSERARTT